MTLETAERVRPTNAPAPATVNTAADDITADEFRARVTKVRGAIDKAGLVGLVAFGDCWRGANVSYFTEFRPLDGVSDIANAVLFLGVNEEPVLFVSDQCLMYAASVTTFPVVSFREMGERLRKFAGTHPAGAVGLAGQAYIPASVLDRIKDGLGTLKLKPTPVLAEIKSI
jgi:Xaa-Pro aminopeptidase